MKRNARKVFNELKRKGVPVFETDDYGAHFIYSKLGEAKDAIKAIHRTT